MELDNIVKQSSRAQNWVIFKFSKLGLVDVLEHRAQQGCFFSIFSCPKVASSVPLYLLHI